MKVEREILEPMAGVSREIGFYLSGMEETRAQLRDAATNLTSKELAQRVLPNAHQIGGLILHIGEAESWWILFDCRRKRVGRESQTVCSFSETDGMSIKVLVSSKRFIRVWK